MPNMTLLLGFCLESIVSRIKISWVKSNIKFWSNINVLNAIRKRKKNHKKFKQSGKGIDEDNCKYPDFSLAKITRELWNLYRCLLKAEAILNINGVVFFD